MLATLVILLLLYLAITTWTELSAGGGSGGALAGVGAAVWARIQASRLAKAYRPDSPNDERG